MTSRRSDLASVTSSGMDDLTEVKEDVATIKETLKWHKWLLVGLLATTALPRVGGPDMPGAVAALASHLLA